MLESLFTKVAGLTPVLKSICQRLLLHCTRTTPFYLSVFLYIQHILPLRVKWSFPLRSSVNLGYFVSNPLLFLDLLMYFLTALSNVAHQKLSVTPKLKTPHGFRTKFSNIERNSKPKPTSHITFSLTERFWWAFTNSNNQPSLS